MNYIIDANNLAGKLNLLEEDNFDKKLISIIKEWLGEKQKTIVLVFDSLYPLGDKISLGNIEIIYSPRDNHNSSADDMILEIFSQWALARQKNREDEGFSLNIIKKIAKNDLVFVSDDIDLRNEVVNIKENINKNIKLMYNDEFIRIMNRKSDMKKEEDGFRNLDDDSVEKINKELLNIW